MPLPLRVLIELALFGLTSVVAAAGQPTLAVAFGVLTVATSALNAAQEHQTGAPMPSARA